MKQRCCLSSKIRQILKWWVLLNAFWIRLRIVKCRFVRYTLDLLDTDIPTNYFVCFHNVFKTSSIHVFKTSSKTCLQGVFKICLQDVFKTCFQGVFKTCLQDVLKTSSRHVFKTPSRRLQDQQMFAGKSSLLYYFWEKNSHL